MKLYWNQLLILPLSRLWGSPTENRAICIVHITKLYTNTQLVEPGGSGQACNLSLLALPFQTSTEGVWDRGLCLYLKPAGKGHTLISHTVECICTKILFTLKQPSPSASSGTPDGGGSEVYSRLMKRVLWSTFAGDGDLNWGFERCLGPEHCGYSKTEWHTQHGSTGKVLCWTMWSMSLPWWETWTHGYTNRNPLTLRALMFTYKSFQLKSCITTERVIMHFGSEDSCLCHFLLWFYPLPSLKGYFTDKMGFQ